MGKSKKRILHKGINDQFSSMTRQDALTKVVQQCSKKKFNEQTKDLILLFGFSCEELLENGAKYEDVMSLRSILK